MAMVDGWNIECQSRGVLSTSLNHYPVVKFLCDLARGGNRAPMNVNGNRSNPLPFWAPKCHTTWTDSTSLVWIAFRVDAFEIVEQGFVCCHPCQGLVRHTYHTHISCAMESFPWRSKAKGLAQQEHALHQAELLHKVHCDLGWASSCWVKGNGSCYHPTWNTNLTYE